MSNQQSNAAPTWYNTIQAYFTAAAGRPNSIACMNQSQYQIDLSNPATFSGPDLTGQGYPTCGLAILAAITPPGPGQPASMPQGSDRQFNATELATYTAWCNANYPIGTPPVGAAEAAGGGYGAPRGNAEDASGEPRPPATGDA